MYSCYKKNWDKIAHGYKLSGSDIDSLIDKARQRGEIKICHDLLVLASKENDIKLFTNIWNMSKNNLSTYVKIYRLFRINCAHGNINICKYIFANTNPPSALFRKFWKLKKFGPFKLIEKDTFEKIIGLYFELKLAYDRDTIIFISDTAASFESREDGGSPLPQISNTTNMIIQLYLNNGLFQDSSNHKILNFKYLFENDDIQHQLTSKTILDYIIMISKTKSDSEIQTMSTILDNVKLEPDETTLCKILYTFTENNNPLIIKFIFKSWLPLIKRHDINQIIFKLLTILAAQPQTDDFVVYLINLYSGHMLIELLTDIMKKSKADNKKCILNMILNKYDDAYVPDKSQLSKLLVAVANNENYVSFKVIYDKWQCVLNVLYTGDELNALICEIMIIMIKFPSSKLTLDYLLNDNYVLGNNGIDLDTFNDVISCASYNNNIFGMRYMLTKYKDNNDLVIDLGHKGFTRYHRSSYSISDIYESMMIKLSKLNDFDIIKLFLEKLKSRDSKSNIEIIKSILKSNKPNNNEYIRYLMKDVDDIFPLAHELLTPCCVSDQLLETNKLLVELHPNIYHSVVIDDMFDLACENSALNTARWLLSMHPDININRSNDSLFVKCCKAKKIDVCRFLKKMCPWYVLIIKQGSIVYYDVFDQDFIDQKITEVKEGQISKVLMELNIKTVDALIDPSNECYICKASHANILKLPCDHYYCLDSLLGYWKNAKNILSCFYCKKSFKFTECINYTNPIVNDDDDMPDDAMIMLLKSQSKQLSKPLSNP